MRSCFPLYQLLKLICLVDQIKNYGGKKNYVKKLGIFFYSFSFSFSVNSFNFS